MKPVLMLGIALIISGAAVLGYDHFNYTTTEEVLKLGPITATAERTHTVALPAILGWVLVGGGVCVLVLAAMSKKH